VKSNKIKKYTNVLVVGPEGSGTKMLTHLVNDLLKHICYRRINAGRKQTKKLDQLNINTVYHISIPHLRPRVWIKPFNKPHTLVLGMYRNKLDAVYSAWKRFRRPNDKRNCKSSVQLYMNHYDKALNIMYSVCDHVISYEDFAIMKSPKEYLCKYLGIDKSHSRKIKFTAENRNGKYLDDPIFISQLPK